MGVQRWRGQGDVPSDWGRCVLTIGVFDGVHRGHAELIARAVKAAVKIPVIVTGGFQEVPEVSAERTSFRFSSPLP
mgnify:CR=1 FL=1